MQSLESLKAGAWPGGRAGQLVMAAVGQPQPGHPALLRNTTHRETWCPENNWYYHAPTINILSKHFTE